MTSGRRKLSVETIALFLMGAVFVGAGVFLCVTAYRAAHSSADRATPSLALLTPALPPAMSEAPAAFAAPRPNSIFGPPPGEEPPTPALAPAPEPVQRPALASISPAAPAPLPPSRPIELDSPLSALGSRMLLGSLGDYDRFTAVYDLTAHVVYLPDGERLEAHSGLGSFRDDPTHVDEKDRGATPPHVYDLTLREDLFHGVRALRLNPVGGPSTVFDRVGLLAHTYMLGAKGDSNGCVSFKNYDAFLQAYQNGIVKRLAVVSRLK
jgi:hypothetical protein